MHVQCTCAACGTGFLRVPSKVGRYCSRAFSNSHRPNDNRPRKSLEDRFWSYVFPEPNSGCWLWGSHIDEDGYGRIGAGGGRGSMLLAHCVSWGMLRGVIPFGLKLDHLCRNRACANPDHLEPVTNKVNILRGVGAGALNARKTHCPQGHAYTEENTYRGPEHARRRQCRTCTSERWKKRAAGRQLLPIHSLPLTSSA